MHQKFWPKTNAATRDRVLLLLAILLLLETRKRTIRKQIALKSSDDEKQSRVVSSNLPLVNYY